MSSLRDRLSRHIKTEQRREADTRQPSMESDERTAVSESRSTIEDSGSEVASAALSGQWAGMDMYVRSNENGEFLMRRREYGFPYRHGHYDLGEFTRTGAELLALSAGATVEAERVLFLDTETTGLGIGAGNVPFMIGLGYYTRRTFVVEQLFIRNLAEELAMLAYLDELLLRFSHLVTYNGRSFDWPIVKNRFVLNRMPLRNELIGQLDFLYPARSLWRTVLSTCRLAVVEEERLGFTREDDVPGSMAPTLYFRYLAEQEPKVVEPVFVHNENDILSLAALAVHLTHALAGRLDFESMPDEELYRTGLWLDKRGKSALTDRLFNCLLERGEGNRHAYAAAVAPVYKRRGDVERSTALWRLAVAGFGRSLAAPLEPWIELAIHYEHKRKDYTAALSCAKEARELALARQSADKATVDKFRALADDLTKRIERIERKQMALGKTNKRRREDGPEVMSLF